MDHETSIVGAASESSVKSYDNNTNTRFLRSSIRSSVRMSNSVAVVNSAIVSNNYDCLASTSGVYESSDDSVDFNEFNKTLRILDEEFEIEQRNGHLWSYRARYVLNFATRRILNLVCLPVYWILVQIFVFEKWMLHRRKAIERNQPMVQLPQIRGLYSYQDSASASTSRYRRSVFSNSEESEHMHNNYQRTDESTFANAKAIHSHKESVSGKILAFFTDRLKWNRENTVEVVHEANGNGNGRVIPRRTTRGSSVAATAKGVDIVNNGNGSYGALHRDRATPVGSYRQRARYSDFVNKKVNACRTIFHAFKDKTASMYHNFSQSQGRGDDRDGDTDGPSKLWILLLLLLLTGGLMTWWQSELVGMSPGFVLDHIVSLKDAWMNPNPDPNEQFSAPPVVNEDPKGVPQIPLPPEPEPDLYLNVLSSEPITPPVISVKPEPVVEIPMVQSDPEPPSPAPVDPRLIVPIPVSVSSPQVVPPVVSPEVACVTCPPVNNIDVDALKKELREHFTALIKEQCVSNCDCTAGRGGGDGGGPNGGGGSTGGDVDEKIRAAIEKYDADKTGLPDLALEPSGGSVVSTRCTKHSQNKNSVVSFFGIPIWSPPNNPRVVIQPGLVPGECWSFEGSIGYIVIKLAGPSTIKGFSLEHIPRRISPHGNIKSAPKDFQVVGLMDYNDPSTEFVFGNYTYRDIDQPLQYFEVQNLAQQAYPYVELKILSNHGNIEFTCVYRFRVHGHF